MATPRSAKQTLVVADPDSTEGRRLVLAELFGPTAEVITAGADLPSPLDYEAIVVSHLAVSPGRSWLGELEHSLKNGGRLLVLLGSQLDDEWAGWLGIRPGQSYPAGEWFLKPAFTAAGLTERFPSEVALRDAPVEVRSLRRGTGAGGFRQRLVQGPPSRRRAAARRRSDRHERSRPTGRGALAHRAGSTLSPLPD